MKPILKTITPELAAQLLEANTNNRPINQNHVNDLAREMVLGRWKLNGDIIRIAKDGTLMDGQHRLTAVVKARVAIRSWVMEAVDLDVFDTIDVGKRRSPGDTLGCVGNTNCHRLAAALSLLHRYNRGRPNSNNAFSNTEIIEIAKLYPELPNFLRTEIKGPTLIPPSVLDVLFYLFSLKDAAMAEVFVNAVTKGTNLHDGSPWYHLRQRLIANQLTRSKLNKPMLMALCIRAWNNARNGVMVTKLVLPHRGKNEEQNFPTIK